MDESDAIEQLPGVGPATAEKLIEAGFTDLMSIAVSSPQMLAEMADIGVNSAVKIIAAARKQADIGGFETGDVLLEKRKLVGKVPTGSWAGVSRPRPSPSSSASSARARPRSVTRWR